VRFRTPLQRERCVLQYHWRSAEILVVDVHMTSTANFKIRLRLVSRGAHVVAPSVGTVRAAPASGGGQNAAARWEGRTLYVWEGCTNMSLYSWPTADPKPHRALRGKSHYLCADLHHRPADAVRRNTTSSTSPRTRSLGTGRGKGTTHTFWTCLAASDDVLACLYVPQASHPIVTVCVRNLIRDCIWLWHHRHSHERSQ
jgi:hypothetical protein